MSDQLRIYLLINLTLLIAQCGLSLLHHGLASMIVMGVVVGLNAGWIGALWAYRQALSSFGVERGEITP